MTPKLLIIYTGGTFGMQFSRDGKQLKDFDFLQLKESIPELNRLNVSIHTIQMAKLIDSSDMNIEYWCLLAKLIHDSYAAYDGFIILHGTDTMAYTSSILSFMLQNLSKPIVLTGALLPLGDVRNDARENLITAIEIAIMRKKGQAMFQEVVICYNNQLIRGNRATKTDSDHFNSITSPNYPPLAEIGTKIDVKHNLLWQNKQSLKVRNKIEENIFLLKLFPSMSEKMISPLLKIPLKGLVLETFGNGNTPSFPWFYHFLEKIVDKGGTVLNISQCISGTVSQGKYQASEALNNLGIIDGKDMTTEAAVTKLMYALANEPSNIKKTLSASIAGEMS